MIICAREIGNGRGFREARRRADRCDDHEQKEIATLRIHRSLQRKLACSADDVEECLLAAGDGIQRPVQRFG